MKRHRFQIMFYLRKDRKNSKGKVPIYARVTLDNESSSMSTGRFVYAKEWDTKKGYLKPSTQEADEINQDIDLLRARIFEIRRELTANSSFVSASNIVRSLQGEGEKKHTLLEVFGYHNQLMKEQIGKGFACKTHRNYKVTEGFLGQFLRKHYRRSDIYLKELTAKHIHDFFYYLRVSKGNSNNTAMKHLARLKKVVRFAIGNEWLANNPFFNIKIQYDDIEKQILDKDELLSLESEGLTSRKLQKVRDIFVFMCYTGMAYIDIKYLRRDMIRRGIDGNLWVTGNRIKSTVRYSIPLLPKAVEIVKAYDDPAREYVLPVMSNQKMNEYIKKIAEICKINKSLSCHSARHTFATTVTLVNGVPIETVSKMLGHTSLKITQQYAKVVDVKISQDMQALREKLSKQKNPKKDAKTSTG